MPKLSCDEILFSLEHHEYSESELRRLRTALWKRIEAGRASSEEHDVINRVDDELGMHFPGARMVTLS